MDQATGERRFARCYALWAAATNFRRHNSPEVDKVACRDRNKPSAQTVLKALALTATLGAAAYLGHQIATNTTHPATLAFTVLSALGTGTALAGDIRRGLRTIRRHLSRKPGPRFRCTHGDPARWDDDEYEAYFAITATQTPRNIHPAA